MNLDWDATGEEALQAITTAEDLSRWAREHVAYIRGRAASWIGQNGSLELLDGKRYVAAVKRTEKIRNQGAAFDDALTSLGGDFTEFSKLIRSGALLPGRCADILGEDFRREHFKIETVMDEDGQPARELRLLPAKKKGAK
jgi:hypothetical protein